MPLDSEGDLNLSPLVKVTHAPVSTAILEPLQALSSHFQSHDKPIESSYLVKEFTDYYLA